MTNLPLTSPFLVELSPRDTTWDTHKRQSLIVQDIYQRGGYKRWADRMEHCSENLIFKLASSATGELALKLKSADCCRVRFCPTCQWRRSLMWQAKFWQVLPTIVQDYPNHQFLFLTLTVKNCEMGELRQTLTWMNKAWVRLTQRDVWPGDGWLKSVEVTRNEKTGQVHPHFHALIMVPSRYFSGDYYLSHEKWVQLWRRSLRIQYDPQVNIRAIKPKNPLPEFFEPELPSNEIPYALRSAVSEVLKYAVKPPKEALGGEWVMELHEQLHKTRAVATGGVFKKYLATVGKEPDDLVHSDMEEITMEEAVDTVAVFGWRPVPKMYGLEL